MSERHPSGSIAPSLGLSPSLYDRNGVGGVECVGHRIEERPIFLLPLPVISFFRSFVSRFFYLFFFWLCLNTSPFLFLFFLLFSFFFVFFVSPLSLSLITLSYCLPPPCLPFPSPATVSLVCRFPLLRHSTPTHTNTLTLSTLLHTHRRAHFHNGYMLIPDFTLSPSLSVSFSS